MADSGASYSVPPENDLSFRSVGTESGTIVIDVVGAASLLRISESAVLKRIKAGHLTAQKVAGRWQVFLPETETAGTERKNGREERNANPPFRKSGTPETDSVPAVSGAARAQLAAIRDEFVAPLVDRIQAQAEEIGTLKAERDALWSTVERLEAERDALQAAKDAPVAANEGPGKAMPAASVWGRFLRWLRGAEEDL